MRVEQVGRDGPKRAAQVAGARGGPRWFGALLLDRGRVLGHQRSRPNAATGVVTAICGVPATSGPKAEMAVCIASL